MSLEDVGQELDVIAQNLVPNPEASVRIGTSGEGVYELMTIDQMANAIGLSGILFYFLIPTIVVLVTIKVISRLKKRSTNKNKHKVFIDKVYSNDEMAYKIIGDMPNKIDYSKYRMLQLEFDEQGRVVSSKLNR